MMLLKNEPELSEEMERNVYNVGFIEDDEKFHDTIRDGLKNESMIKNSYFWTCAQDFFESPHLADLHILFLDIHLGSDSGTEILPIIHKKYPDLKKIMLTNLSSEEEIFSSLKRGAIGYVLKSELQDLGEVIRTVLNNGAVITPTIALRVLNYFKKIPTAPGSFEYPPLTPRERELLNFLITGMKRKDAAKHMNVTEDTIKWHIKNIYEKLNVNSRLELLKRTQEPGFRI